MVTSKKTSKKKAAKKGTKKTIKPSAKVRIQLPLDAEKIEAIKRCLANRSLTVTMSKADIGKARLGDPYQYD